MNNRSERRLRYLVVSGLIPPTPLGLPSGAGYEYPPLRVQEVWVEQLEADCDRFNDELKKLRSFILPGGTPCLLYTSPSPRD